MGHSAKRCPHVKPAPKNVPVANCATSAGSQNPNWLFDTRASHHVTIDLQNLSLHSNYEGPDDIILGDGSGLKITHVGTTQLSSPSYIFSLKNVICVPFMKRNLISVSQFCKSNNASIEFSPTYFFVKDLRTGATLFKRPNKNNTYEWQSMRHESTSTSPVAFVGIKHSTTDWHQRLRHPSSRILQFLIKRHFLSSLSSTSFVSFESCSCNKSHRLPFHVSTLRSKGLLEILYTGVWGPAPIESVDGFKY